MQRQSLGSAGSKLHAGGEEENLNGGGTASEDAKTEKPIRSGSRPEATVHLIPVVIILCIVVLYLCSHDPSPKELEAIGASGRLRRAAKAVSVGAIGRLIGGAARSGVNRRLKEAEKRRSRKLGAL